MEKVMKHSVSFTVKHYPMSGYAYQISWTCSCGKHGTLNDGHTQITLKRARAASKKHYTKAA